MQNDEFDVSKRAKQWGSLIALCVLAGIVLFFWWYPPGNFVTDELLDRIEARFGLLIFPLFITAGAIFTSVGLPRQLLAFAAGYLWGVPVGVLLGSLAAILGCLLTFTFSRRFLSDIVSGKLTKPQQLLNRFVDRDPFIKIIILRLQPLGTNLLTNLAAGVSRIDAKVFLTASFLGYLPQMFVFSLTGAGLRVGSQVQLVLSAVLFGLSLLLAWYLYRKGTLFS